MIINTLNSLKQMRRVIRSLKRYKKEKDPHYLNFNFLLNTQPKENLIIIGDKNGESRKSKKLKVSKNEKNKNEVKIKGYIKMLLKNC